MKNQNQTNNLSRVLLVCCLLFILSFGKVPDNWQQLNEAASNKEIGFMIAVKYRQGSFDKLKQVLFSVSDPSSPDYGKHWKREQIWELIGPDQSNVQLIENWLHSFGISQIERTENGAFLIVRTTINKVEELLKVKMFEYKRQSDGRRLIRSNEIYQLTESHLIDSIELITGIHDFPSGRKSPIKHNQPIVIEQPQPQQQQPYQSQQSTTNSTAPAPVPQLIYSSTTQLFATLIPYCLDGKPSTNLTQLCAQQGSQLTWFAFDLSSGPLYKHVVSYNITLSPQNSDCSMQGSTPLCTILIEPVASFKLTNVTVRGGYANGSMTGMAAYAYKISPNSLVTPHLLRQHYGIAQSEGLIVHPAVSQAVVEFDNQFYSPSDMQRFLKLMSLPNANISIVGFNNGNNPGGEASLDIQYIVAMAPRVPTTFWSNDPSAWILDWAAQVNNATNPPLVNSISYLEAEQDMTKLFPPGYLDRSEQELIKMGIRGLTVLACAGDAGVSNKNHGNHDCTPFHPNFPAVSPYVTAVSATILTTLTSEICLTPIFGLTNTECTRVGEMAMSGNLGFFWTTGGGFSNHWGRQSWQSQAVGDYFAQTPSKDLPPEKYWNSKGRGIPDVSAVGHNLMIVWGGVLMPIDGTSAATPIFAGIISLVNNKRLLAGKGPIGYLNPALYKSFSQNPSAFNDVVFGENRCGSYDPSAKLPIVEDYCCPYGFNATVGWDPVTGLGTPNYPRLADLLFNL